MPLTFAHQLTLSSDQESAVRQIQRWFQDPHPGAIRFGGLAGTGKTTIAAHLPRALDLSPSRVAYCAYTGKAARVLRQKLSQAGVGAEATTIHSLIYRPQDVHCRDCPSNWGNSCHRTDSSCGCGVVFKRVDELEPSLELIIVDEASMVDESIHDDLRSYGVPIIWMGDHGQLPPVKGTFSLMEAPDIRLETIHRQVADSPILRLARRAREGEAIPVGDYGPGVSKTKRFELDIDTEEDHVVLCYTNPTRVWLNAQIRQLFGYRPDRPVPGDRVICLRNNHKVGIFNGMLGTIKSIHPRGTAYVVEIAPDHETFTYKGVVSSEQFGHPKTLPDRSLDLWDYGYCLTVHKAQGSEADRVTLLDEFPYRDGNRSRWLYTGITRAKRELKIIDHHGKRRLQLQAIDDDPVLTDD